MTTDAVSPTTPQALEEVIDNAVRVIIFRAAKRGVPLTQEDIPAIRDAVTRAVGAGMDPQQVAAAAAIDPGVAGGLVRDAAGGASLSPGTTASTGDSIAASIAALTENFKASDEGRTVAIAQASGEFPELEAAAAGDSTTNNEFGYGDPTQDIESIGVDGQSRVISQDRRNGQIYINGVLQSSAPGAESSLANQALAEAKRNGFEDPEVREAELKLLAGQLANVGAQVAIDQRRLDWQVANGNRTFALSLTESILQQENFIAGLQTQMFDISQRIKQENANTINRRQDLTAGFEAEAAQASANRALQYSIAIDQMLSRNLDQQIQIAGQIADFDPGDIVANIAALDQFGSIGNALDSNFTALTSNSLQPLARAFNAQDDAKAEQARLEGVQNQLTQTVNASLQPGFGVPNIPEPVTLDPAESLAFLEGLNISSTEDALGLFNGLLSQVQGGAGVTLPDINTADSGGLENLGIPAPAAAGNNSQPPVQVDPGDGLADDVDEFGFPVPSAEHGATVAPGTPVVVGDSGDGTENKELAMIDEQGNLVVKPIDDLEHAQFGLNTSLGNTSPENVDPSRALEHLMDIFRRALSGFQNATQSSIPGGGFNPVNVAAPGTDPLLQEAAGGLAAAGRGINTGLFAREIKRITPIGVSRRTTRRTR